VLDPALDAQRVADRVRGVVVLASAAFDVAAAKVHIECSAVRGGGYGQAEEPLILVERRDIPAGRCEFLGRQQRVVAAGHEGGEGERAARAILRLVRSEEHTSELQSPD